MSGRNGTAWSQQAKLTGSDTASFHQFGVSVSIVEGTIVAGAGFASYQGSNPGAAYVFKREGTGWTQTAKLTSGDGMTGDTFGRSVAMQGNTVVVGADNESNNGASSGSVYFFNLASTVPLTTVTLIFPNTGGDFERENQVTLNWTSTNAGSSNVVLSMKRDAAASSSEPDGVNWIRFTEDTPNDGVEIVTIPLEAALAEDWRFYVRHIDSGAFDASDATFLLGCDLRGDMNCNGAITAFEIAVLRAFLVLDDIPQVLLRNADVTACSVDERNVENINVVDVAYYRDFLVNFQEWPPCQTTPLQNGFDDIAVLTSDQSVYPITTAGIQMTFSLEPGAAAPPDITFHAFKVTFDDLPDYLQADSLSVSKVNPDDSWTVSASATIRGDRYITFTDTGVPEDFSSPVPVFQLQLDVDPNAVIESASVPLILELADGEFEEHFFAGEFQLAPIPNTQILAIDGSAGDQFGYAVAADATTFVAGANQDDDAGTNSGAAYVYTLNDGAWQQAAKLTASDAGEFDEFGSALALDGDTLIVGARENSASTHGAAYVFVRDNDTWSQEAKLIASNALGNFNFFGDAVAINDSTIVVGAPLDDTLRGAAHIFERTGSIWSETQKLVASDSTGFGQFGISVAIDGNTIAVGASVMTGGGAVYLFEKCEGVWVESQKLTANDGASGDEFGQSVTLNDCFIIVGAPGNDNGGTNAGAAYVFRDLAGTWTETTQLTANDASANDGFGTAVALDGGIGTIGAFRDDDLGVDSGSVYVFRLDSGAWAQTEKLTTPDGLPSDRFGSSVVMSGYLGVSGAPGDDNLGSNSGSVYAFNLGLTPPPEVDLDMTMTAPGIAIVGNDLTYNMTVTNNGPDDATNAMLSDTLPESVIFMSATPAASCSHDSGIVTCTLGTLANDVETTVTITATTTMTGVITNTATVAADETDSATSNNTAFVNTTVVRQVTSSSSTVSNPATPRRGCRDCFKSPLHNLYCPNMILQEGFGGAGHRKC